MGRKRGRPAFRPTRAQRRQVETLAATMAQESLARIIGCTVETLQKHFAVELRTSREILHSEAMEALRQAVGKKSVPAIRLQLQLTAPQPVMTEDPDLVDMEVSQVAKAPKLGKKEIAQAEARIAGLDSEWGEDLAVPAPTTQH